MYSVDASQLHLPSAYQISSIGFLESLSRELDAPVINVTGCIDTETHYQALCPIEICS